MGIRIDANTIVRRTFKVNTCLLLFALCITLFLTACTQTGGKDADSSSSPLNKEYIQTVIDFPEGVYHIESLEKTSTGKLWAMGKRTTSGEDWRISYSSLWEFNDDNSWEELFNFSELLALTETQGVLVSSITRDGKVLCLVLDRADYSSGIKFYLIDPQLESGYCDLNIDTSEFIKDNTKDELENVVRQIVSLGNGQLLIQKGSNSLLSLIYQMKILLIYIQIKTA